MFKFIRTKKTLNEELENAKDYIALRDMKVFARNDIPITPVENSTTLLTTNEVWKDFTKVSDLSINFLGEEGNKKSYTFKAKETSDGFVVAETDVYFPSYDSPRAVILIGDYDSLPQQDVIDAIVNKGCYVFTVDYNAIKSETHTSFPYSLFYGTRGKEENHLYEVCPTAKETCQYLYGEILRHLVYFIDENFPNKELIAVGIRYGTELAMLLAGTEKKRISGVGCICGAGYPELSDVPKYTESDYEPDYNTLAWMTGVSGVAYMRGYEKPVFIAIGTNSTISDVDRLASFKALLKSELTLSITPHGADNVDKRSFNLFLKWLDCTFWKCSFPKPPKTTIEINRDGLVYANITATGIPEIKQAMLYYSYGNTNHKSRRWKQKAGETVGHAQHLAKLIFTRPFEHLYFYTEITYVNGLVATEAPQYFNTEKYRLRLYPSKKGSILFMHEGENRFYEICDKPVIMSDGITEGVTPVGTKGSVFKDGSMRLFVAENCKLADNSRLLQVASYSSSKSYFLELAVSLRHSKTVYKASKKVVSSTTFADIKFSVKDFKDEFFHPLTSWKDVISITVVNKDVIINKMIFI